MTTPTPNAIAAVIARVLHAVASRQDRLQGGQRTMTTTPDTLKTIAAEYGWTYEGQVTVRGSKDYGFVRDDMRLLFNRRGYGNAVLNIGPYRIRLKRPGLTKPREEIARALLPTITREWALDQLRQRHANEVEAAQHRLNDAKHAQIAFEAFADGTLTHAPRRLRDGTIIPLCHATSQTFVTPPASPLCPTCVDLLIDLPPEQAP